MQPLTENRAVPTIYFAATALHAIRAEASVSLDGAETGGILLGRADTSGLETFVKHAGGPGPNALRTPERFDRDLEHAQRFAEYAWHLDGSEWIGEWHTHPAGLMAPSDRDLSSYQAHLADVELRFPQFVCVIVGLHDTHGVTLSGWIIRPTAVLSARLIPGGNHPT